MSDINPENPKTRPRIPFPHSNDEGQARADLAAEIGIADRTAARKNWPTFYVGGVAYVMRNATLKLIAAEAKRRHEPQPRRGRSSI
jgi:hypothetical protein